MVLLRAAYCSCTRRLASEGCSVVEILDCLKKYGERLDLDIAKETGVPLERVRERLAALAAAGAVVTCNALREGQTHRSLAMPRVGLRPAYGTRAQGYAQGVNDHFACFCGALRA